MVGVFGLMCCDTVLLLLKAILTMVCLKRLVTIFNIWTTVCEYCPFYVCFCCRFLGLPFVEFAVLNCKIPYIFYRYFRI